MRLRMWLMFWRFKFATVMLCPLGLHLPWPKDRFHPEMCAYCAKGRREPSR